MEEPHTIAEVSQALFGEVHGYNVLLALEEAGAHVEYLYQRGLLGIENLEEAGEHRPRPHPYRCLPCQACSKSYAGCKFASQTGVNP